MLKVSINRVNANPIEEYVNVLEKYNLKGIYTPKESDWTPDEGTYAILELKSHEEILDLINNLGVKVIVVPSSMAAYFKYVESRYRDDVDVALTIYDEFIYW